MTIEAQLALIEARIGVEAAIHAYARAVRRCRADEAAALFTADGVFAIFDGTPDGSRLSERARLEGPAAIEAYVAQARGPVPMIHNLEITIDGDRAVAESVMEAPVLGTDKRVMGEYRDTLVRQAQRWRFAERLYTIFAAG